MQNVINISQSLFSLSLLDFIYSFTHLLGVKQGKTSHFNQQFHNLEEKKLINSLAKSWMRRSLPLLCLCDEYKAAAS